MRPIRAALRMDLRGPLRADIRPVASPGPRRRVCKSCQCKRYRAGRSAERAQGLRHGPRGQLEFGRPSGPRGDRTATVRLEGRLAYRMGSWGHTWGYCAPGSPESWRDVGTL